MFIDDKDLRFDRTDVRSRIIVINEIHALDSNIFNGPFVKSCFPLCLYWIVCVRSRYSGGCKMYLAYHALGDLFWQVHHLEVIVV